MLQGSTQYQISAGIFYCFSNNLKKKLFSVNHSRDVINKRLQRFNYHKFETFALENFFYLSLYSMFKHRPSSLDGLFNYLIEEGSKKEFIKFKTSLKEIPILFKKDIDLISQNYISITDKELLKLYRDNSINFYTFYFVLKKLGKLDAYRNSRINGYLIQSIENIFKYVTLSKETLSIIDFNLRKIK
jgi:hypothetical protein